MSAEPRDDARSVVLERIRSSLGREGDSAPAAMAVPRDYRVEGERPHEEVLDLLVDRLEDYDATVHRVAAGEVPATIAELLSGAGRVVTPEALPPEWLSGLDGTSVELLADSAGQPLDVETLDGVDAVVTASTVAIADTGTIVLADERSGRRAVTLVPDHHVVVVASADVVDLVPEAIRRLVELGADTAPTTMVSGPSATVDIEMIRVHGVHGPRRLDVVLAV